MILKVIPLIFILWALVLFCLQLSVPAVGSLESFFSEAGAFSTHVMDLQIFGDK